MSVEYLPPEILKKKVFELITESRAALRHGEVDITGVEKAVRVYCEALAAMPIDEGRLHAGELELLMKEITALGDELVASREKVRIQLESLGKMKQANVAYQKSDKIGEKHIKKETE
jgi:hypothetical protein